MKTTHDFDPASDVCKGCGAARVIIDEDRTGCPMPKIEVEFMGDFETDRRCARSEILWDHLEHGRAYTRFQLLVSVEKVALITDEAATTYIKALMLAEARQMLRLGYIWHQRFAPKDGESMLYLGVPK